MDDSDYEISLSPLQRDTYFNDLVTSQDFSVSVNFTSPSDVVICYDLRISGTVNPQFELGLISCLRQIYFPYSLRNALISEITSEFRRSPPASTPLSFGVRAVINVYAIGRSGAEDEEEVMLTTSSPSNRVEALEKVRIEGGERETKCAVCLEEFPVGLEVAKLPCSHIFHGGCVRTWLEKRDTCPLCRDVVVSSASDDETTVIIPGRRLGQ